MLKVIEVASGEYGHEFLDRMVETIDNGRVIDWKPPMSILDQYDENLIERKQAIEKQELSKFEEEINPNNLKFKCSSWQQFSVLFRRASKQIYSNKVSDENLFSKNKIKNLLYITELSSSSDNNAHFSWTCYRWTILSNGK